MLIQTRWNEQAAVNKDEEDEGAIVAVECVQCIVVRFAYNGMVVQIPEESRRFSDILPARFGVEYV